jgi:hypothetical protein
VLPPFSARLCADATIASQDARQVRGAAPELDGMTGPARVSFRTAAGSEPVMPDRFLVRERDDDYEGDHNKGDRISIKAFPIEVNTHRTLLFAEAAKQISLGCRGSNGVPAMHEAQQHFGCAAHKAGRR